MSSGWSCWRSLGSTSMRSQGSGEGSVTSRLVPASQLVGRRHQLAPLRPKLPPGEPFGDGDRLRTVGHEPGPEQIARDQSADAVANLLLVDEQLLAAGQQFAQLGVEGLLEHDRVVVGLLGAVERRHAQLVVVVEVVGSGDEGDDVVEALLTDPDDLLLAAHAAMVVPVAPGALADGEPVLEHPHEVAGGDALGPLALGRWHVRFSLVGVTRPWPARRRRCPRPARWRPRRGRAPWRRRAAATRRPWRSNPRAGRGRAERRPCGRPGPPTRRAMTCGSRPRAPG